MCAQPSVGTVRNKQKSKNAPAFDLDSQLRRLTGVNLMDVPGMNSLTALYLIGEIGLGAVDIST